MSVKLISSPFYWGEALWALGSLWDLVLGATDIKHMLHLCKHNPQQPAACHFKLTICQTCECRQKQQDSYSWTVLHHARGFFIGSVQKTHSLRHSDLYPTQTVYEMKSPQTASNSTGSISAAVHSHKLEHPSTQSRFFSFIHAPQVCV